MSDIEDVILDLDPNVILNADTPAKTYVGSILVLTYSQKSYQSLSINKDDPYFDLVDNKLYLKNSGANLLQNINSIVLTVSVTDTNTPPGLFTVGFGVFFRSFLGIEKIKENQVNFSLNLRNTFAFLSSITKRTLY
jgi:hypothetical protein